jgi:hypothetical protein
MTAAQYKRSLQVFYRLEYSNGASDDPLTRGTIGGYAATESVFPPKDDAGAMRMELILDSFQTAALRLLTSGTLTSLHCLCCHTALATAEDVNYYPLSYTVTGNKRGQRLLRVFLVTCLNRKCVRSVFEHYLTHGGLVDVGNRAFLHRPCLVCVRLDSPSKRWSTCGKCKRAAYCSPECQRDHWVKHRAVCH